MRTAKWVILLLALLLACAIVSACCLASFSKGEREAEIYRERLGIGNSDEEVEGFMTRELKGLAHSEALEKLSQWGDVEVTEDCSITETVGRCVVNVGNFLETGTSYEFTIFYIDSKVDSVAIEHS